MKRLSGRALWGILLIVLGLTFLLQELQVVGNAFQYLWIGILLAAGLIFLWVYFRDEKQWWAVIPGMALLGLSFSSLEGAMHLFPGSDWGGPVFLGCLGGSFWLVYIRRQQNWWAIIPGGVLLTLAVVAGMDAVGIVGDGGVFFIGLGLTFALVALLPGHDSDTRWSLIPAAVLLLLGVTQITVLGSAFLDYWPLILIIIGGYVLVQAWRDS